MHELYKISWALTLPSREGHLFPGLWSQQLESDKMDYWVPWNIILTGWLVRASHLGVSIIDIHSQTFSVEVELQYFSGQSPGPAFIINFCCLPNYVWSGCMWQSDTLLAATKSSGWDKFSFLNILTCLIFRCHIQGLSAPIKVANSYHSSWLHMVFQQEQC